MRTECFLHEKWKCFTHEKSVVHIERGKISPRIVSFLRDHLFLGPRASFLCKSCISKASFLMSDDSSSASSTNRNTTTKPSLKSTVSCLINWLEDYSLLIDDVKENEWSKLF